MKQEIDEIKRTLTHYMKVHYKIIGQQQYNPYLFKDFFAYNLKGNYSFIQEELALKEQINHYAKYRNHLKFEEPEMLMRWHLLSKTSKQCKVYLSMDLEIKYRGVPTTTYIKNIEHEFVLVKEGTTWKIEENKYTNPFNIVRTEKESRKIEKGKKSWSFREREEIALPKGIYKREKAIEYAKRYALIPNTKEWKNYESMGGDCTNFTSQCLFEGGIPFDHQGKYVTQKWYWYSDHYRTPSFTSANAFKDYAIGNKGFGLVAKLGDLQTMKIGDIVQLGNLSQTTHSMIVVEIIKDDKNPEVIKDLLVAQHSGVGGIRGYNIPLSTKPLERLYYNILGYNP